MSSIYLLTDHDGRRKGDVISVPHNRGREMVRTGVGVDWNGGKGVPAISETLVEVDSIEQAEFMLNEPGTAIASDVIDLQGSTQTILAPLSEEDAAKVEAIIAEQARSDESKAAIPADLVEAQQRKEQKRQQREKAAPKPKKNPPAKPAETVN